MCPLFRCINAVRALFQRGALAFTFFLGLFETALAAEARRRGFDGVVCGHIHQAEMRMVDGVQYLNGGDWVESCTALVEHADGRLEVVDWAAENRLSFFAAMPAPAAA